MNGIMNRALAVACMAGVIGSAGCAGGERYRNLVDPCSMQRYGAESRQELITCFAPQVQNGRILDQTIWNYDFELGTATLNPSGYDKLDQIVRRRPEPDSRIFIQTARDLKYDPALPDAYADARRELDAKRGAAIEKYLTAQTVGRPMQFTMLVHDPAETGMSAVGAATAFRLQQRAYVGTGVTTIGSGGSSGTAIGTVTSTGGQPAGVQVGTPPQGGAAATQGGMAPMP
jgi:hypothetical protein